MSNPEVLKEQGNKDFMLKHYDDAIKNYTAAIELTTENPNHVYFANRANAYLETADNNKCIEDCEMAIKIEPKYVKSYFRKAKV